MFDREKMEFAVDVQRRSCKLLRWLDTALEKGMSITEKEALRLAGEGATSEDVALATYGSQLLARVEGRSSGPAVLALWREFAWNKSGSPKKHFKLEAEAIMDAETRLKKKLISM